MAKKKIGIYGNLESTANHKVEDLYIIVDHQSIHFVVKHLVSNNFVAFESFVSGADLNGFSPLLAYLQNNSKLMHAVYQHVHFVMNNSRVLISKSQHVKDHSIYQNELNMLFGNQSDQDLMVTPFHDDKVVVYSVPDMYQTLLTRAFPTGKWSHYLSSLLQNATENGVYIYFFDGYFIGLIRDHNSVQFVKYFDETEDAQNVYNILNACKYAQINPNNAALYLIGFHPENNQWAIELGKYFKDAINEQASQNGVIKSLQQEYPQHHFATYFIF